MKKELFLILFVSLNTFVLKAQIRFQEGVLLYNKVKSPYQEDSTNVLTLHTELSTSDSLIIFFVLPVEKQKVRYKYGSGIHEIKDLIDSNLISNNTVFIQPGFTRVPWYGNHPSNRQIWQEKYLVDLIEQVSEIFSKYNFKIYLLGFSKSGWGSMSLLLKYPGLIDGIFIWDAPLSTGFNINWGMGQVFRDKNYFENNYRLAKRVCASPRRLKDKIIVIGGYALFRKETETFLEVMDECKIKYHYCQDLLFKHEWNREWIYPLFKHLKSD